MKGLLSTLFPHNLICSQTVSNVEDILWTVTARSSKSSINKDLLILQRDLPTHYQEMARILRGAPLQAISGVLIPTR